MAAPAPWAILAAIPLVSDSGINLSLAHTAPPRITVLTVPSYVSPEPLTQENFPSVLVADPSGLLLLHSTHGRRTAPITITVRGHELTVFRPFFDAYVICDALSSIVYQLPNPPNTIVINAGNLGLLTDPGDSGYYMVAELRPIIGSKLATLLCFSSETWNWSEKELHYPLPLRPWGSHTVLSHQQKLWWVDLSLGLLVCDPFHNVPVLQFISLPKRKVLPSRPEEDPEKTRCIKLSGGKIRFVEVSEVEEPRARVIVHRFRQLQKCRSYSKNIWIKMWTLRETGKWTLKNSLKLKHIWSSPEYLASGLPKKKPVPALIHPMNANIVYLFVENNLVAVNLRTRMLQKWSEYDVGYPPSHILSARFIHGWTLPSSLWQSALLQEDTSSSSDEEESASTSMCRKH